MACYKKTRRDILGSPSSTGVCDLKSAPKLENRENIGMRKAFTWLAIKKTRWDSLGSPSFTGVSDLKSAPKLENRKYLGMRKAFTWLAVKKRGGIF